MRKLSLLLISLFAANGCVLKKPDQTVVLDTGSKIKEYFLDVKADTYLKALATPEETRALSNGSVLNQEEVKVCFLPAGSKILLMQKMTKQLNGHFLIKIRNVVPAASGVEAIVNKGRKPLCNDSYAQQLGYVFARHVLVNGINDGAVAYDNDLGKKYASSALSIGTTSNGSFKDLHGGCWEGVSYAIPHGAGLPDNIFPILKNNAGSTNNVVENGQYFLAWVKENPNLACEIFGLEQSSDKSLASAPVGSTLIYRYQDTTNFDDHNNPVCTFSEKHGHIEIRVTNEGSKSVMCSDGCWRWKEAKGGLRAKCDVATAVLYPSLRCPIAASQPK